MSTYRNDPGFTPFHASQSGHSLVDGNGQQITARAMLDSEGREYTLLTKWRKNRGATQILLDDLDRPIWHTFSQHREGDAWEAMKKRLADDEIFLISPTP